MSQPIQGPISVDLALGIAAKLVEQGMGSVRAEMAVRLAQKDAEIDTLRDGIDRMQEERGMLIERIRELEAETLADEPEHDEAGD